MPESLLAPLAGKLLSIKSKVCRGRIGKSAPALLKSSEYDQAQTATLPVSTTQPICQNIAHNDENKLCQCKESIAEVASQIKRFIPYKHDIQEEQISVSLIGAGAFNFTYNICVRLQMDQDGPKNVVCRLPQRAHDSSHELAVYQELNRHRPSWRYLRTAKLYEADATRNNPLHWPYAMMERIPGTDLCDTWQTLSIKQMCSVAFQLGRMYRELITSTVQAKPGRIRFHSPDNPVELEPLGSFGLISIRGFEKLFKNNANPQHMDAFSAFCARSSAARTPYEILECGLRWQILRSEAGTTRQYHLETYRACIRILEDLEIIGVFNGLGRQSVLCHMDLFPRNIMVDTHRDGSIDVSGIIDWDEALYAPSFVACRPPKWMWRDCYLHDNKERCARCRASRHPEMEDFECRPHDRNGRDIRGAFIEGLGMDEYGLMIANMMRDPAFIWARLLFDVACGRSSYLNYNRPNDAGNQEIDLLTRWEEQKEDISFQRDWGFTLYGEDRAIYPGEVMALVNAL